MQIMMRKTQKEKHSKVSKTDFGSNDGKGSKITCSCHYRNKSGEMIIFQAGDFKDDSNCSVKIRELTSGKLLGKEYSGCL
jgi:hypothetical protein